MVVTDSAADLPLKMIEQEPALKVIPFPKAGNTSPLTLFSAYEAVMTDATVTTIVSAHVSRRISALYDTATLALSMFKPDRACIVLDSASLSLGQGLMVLSLLRCIQQKPVMRMCLDLWEDSRIHTHVWIIQPAAFHDRLLPLWRLSSKLKERLHARVVQTVHPNGILSRGEIIRGRGALETMLEKALREQLARYAHRSYRLGLSVYEPALAARASDEPTRFASDDGWMAPSQAIHTASSEHISVEAWQQWLIDRFQPVELIIGAMHPHLAAFLRFLPGTVAISVSPAYDTRS